MLRPSVRRLAVSAAALAAVLAVAGCGGEDKPEAASTPTASPSESAAPSLEPTPTSSIPNPLEPTADPVSGVPTDFPTSSVPLVPGGVTQPIGEGSVEQGWVLELHLAKESDACFDDAAALLTNRGFTQQPGMIDDGNSKQAQFTTPRYAVIISASPLDTGGCRLGYEVGQIPGGKTQ